MGMVACFVSLSPSDLRELQSSPDGIEEFLYPDDGDNDPPNYIDLDKAWHGIHYLLTGEADGGEQPLAWSIFGGQEFGPEVGYGPARFLTSEQVRVIAPMLSALTLEQLTQRFDPKDMEAKQIYPDVIWVRDGADALAYLLENFETLQAFYAGAALRGDAVLQWLS